MIVTRAFSSTVLLFALVGLLAFTPSKPNAAAKAPPIIFIPGFGGSKLFCGTDEVWPIDLANTEQEAFGSKLRNLGLQSDGVSDAGPCPLHTNEGALIPRYTPTVQYLNDFAPNGLYVFAYDWRKSPELALQALDDLVDRARRAAGVAKVAIVAHEAGGLVARWYVDDPARARKVSRLVTLGTSYWGTPSAWLPLVHGIDLPNLLDLDVFPPDKFSDAAQAMRDFAQNLTGLYYLYPSAKYIARLGSWLARDGKNLNAEQTLLAVGDYGGNGALLRQALLDHAAHLDDAASTGVSVQSVVGTGLGTVYRAHVLTDIPDNQALDYGNGDGVAPLGSASEKGDVDSSYVCDSSSFDLATDPVLLRRIAASIASGKPLVDAGACAASGNEILINAKESIPAVEIPRGDSPSLPLGDAASAGLVHIVQMGNSTILVTNARKPLRLNVAGVDLTIGIREVPTSHGVLGLRPGGGAKTKTCRSVYRKNEHKPVSVDIDLTQDAHANVRNTGRIQDCSPPRTTLVRVRRNGKLEIWRRAVDEPASGRDAGIDNTYIADPTDPATARVWKVVQPVKKHFLYWSCDKVKNCEHAERFPTKHR